MKPQNGTTPASFMIPRNPGEASSAWDFDHAAIDFFLRFNERHPDKNLHDFLGLFEKAVVFEILARTDGNQRSAAKLLGLKNSTFNAKVKKQNIHFLKRPFRESGGGEGPERSFGNGR
jgi:DNA-binding protein Fis